MCSVGGTVEASVAGTVVTGILISVVSSSGSASEEDVVDDSEDDEDVDEDFLPEQPAIDAAIADTVRTAIIFLHIFYFLSYCEKSY